MKRVCIYGDSISSTVYGNGGYTKWLRKSLPTYEIINHAVPGSSLTRLSTGNLQSLLDEGKLPAAETDLILIWHGTNDWYWGAEQGSFENNDPTAFCDSLKNVIMRLRKAAPMAKILWLLPIYRDQIPFEVEEYVGPESESVYLVPNKVKQTLKDYRESILLGSELYSFSVLDINAKVQIHQENQAHFLEDKIHPNEYGAQQLAMVIEKAIRELISK